MRYTLDSERKWASRSVNCQTSSRGDFSGSANAVSLARARTRGRMRFQCRRPADGAGAKPAGPKLQQSRQEPRLPDRVRGHQTRGIFPTAFVSPPMQVSEQRHRAGPSIHPTPPPADAAGRAVHHGVADRPRYRDDACAPQGTGAVDGEGRRGRSDAADPQGVRIGRVARSTQRTLARDPKRCNRTRATVGVTAAPRMQTHDYRRPEWSRDGTPESPRSRDRRL